jgi:hypothetical protein
MSKHYTAASNGDIVAFRAGTKPYAFAEFGRFGFGFSNVQKPGSNRAVQLTRAEYKLILELKHRTRPNATNYNSQHDSWIAKVDLRLACPPLAMKLEGWDV